MNDLTVITTTGTSIFTNGVTFISSPENMGNFPYLTQYIQEAKSEEKYRHLKIGIATMNYIESISETIQNKDEIIRELIKYVEIASGERASAEINTIEKIVKKKKIKKENILIEFIVSKTFISELCLEVLLNYCESEGFQGVYKNIEGLGYESLSFVRTGLKKLIHQVIDSIEQYRDDSNVIIAATGGFKAEFAYITIIGTLYKVELYYIHEAFRDIIKLPPFPIQINQDFYYEYKEFFHWLEEQEKNQNNTTREIIEEKFPNILNNEELFYFIEHEKNNFYISPIVEVLRIFFEQSGMLVIVDAFSEININLVSLSEYAHSFDENCPLFFITNNEMEGKNNKAANLGFDIRYINLNHEDIIGVVEEIIRKELNKKKPAKTIIFACKIDTIESVISEFGKFDVNFIISTGKFSNMVEINDGEILYLPHIPERNGNNFNYDNIDNYLSSWNLNINGNG
ncbi:MAG: putative CRISPR-associated protein, partial [Promethearchaeota archaeon]